LVTEEVAADGVVAFDDPAFLTLRTRLLTQTGTGVIRPGAMACWRCWGILVAAGSALGAH